MSRLGSTSLVTSSLVGACVVLGAGGCDKIFGKKDAGDDAPPPPVVATTSTVPPVAFSVTPVSAFADAAIPEGTPYEQARAYEANGQLWLARLLLEKKALSDDGTKAEVELLADICHQQEDDACVDECSAKLGRKLKFDGGAPKRGALDAGEHKEPESDLSRARDLVLKNKNKEAREILEPKVLDGKASKEEVRLLRTVCQSQGDRMCVALCDAKTK